MAKAKATEPTGTPVDVLSFIAIEPLRINGTDIAPGEPFTATAEVGDPLVAASAASAAE